MKKILPFLALLLVGCSSFDEVSIQESPILASATTEEMTTRATLINDTGTLAEVFPTMTIQTGTTKLDVATTELVKGNYNTGWYWGNSAKTFVSYPKGVINPTIGDNQMTFEYAPSTSMDDIVVAVDKKNNAPLQFDYRHIFCTVNVIYKSLQIAHKITNVTVSGDVQGKCVVTPSSVTWSTTTSGEIHNYQDNTPRQAYHENQDLGIEKFMFVPIGKPKVYVTIDGTTISHVVTCVPEPGKIINVYINDKMEFTEEVNADVNEHKTITKTGENTYMMKVFPSILAQQITSEVAETTVVTKSVPMDYILVLDYSGSMDKSYTANSIKSYAKSVRETSKYDSSTKTYKYTDWEKNQSGYTYFWNGIEHTIKCIKVNSNRCYAYFDYGSYRYFIDTDARLYKSTNKSSNPGSTTLYDLDGTRIPYVSSTTALFARNIKSTVSVNNRLTALESSVFNFLEQVKADAIKSGVEHRVSTIQFQNPSWPRPDGTSSSVASYYINKSYPDYYLKPYSPTTNRTCKNTTSVTSSFVPLSSDENVWTLKDAISSVNYGGSTAIDYGMYLAKLQMANCRTKDNTGKSVSKRIIVFTDGKPTYGKSGETAVLSDFVIPGYNKTGDKPTDSQVGQGAVNFANACKSSGAEIYSVFAGVTNDKPDNSVMVGIATDASHYTDASSSSLSDVFKKISESIVTTEEVTVTKPALKLDSNAYILLNFSDLFDTKDAYLEFYQKGGAKDTNIKYEWSNEKKTLKIWGYDFSKNYGHGNHPGIRILNLKTTCTSKACSLLPDSGLYTSDGKLVEAYNGYDFNVK